MVLFSLPELSDKAEIDEDVMDDMSGEKEIAWRFPEASTTITLNKYYDDELVGTFTEQIFT